MLKQQEIVFPDILIPKRNMKDILNIYIITFYDFFVLSLNNCIETIYMFISIPTEKNI